MNQKFFKGANLIKLVLFLFLGICSINASGQCSPGINANYANCTGDSIEITAASNLIYSWSTGETTQSIWVTSSDAIWVLVSDVDSSGTIICVDSSSFNNPSLVSILEVNISPGDTTICADQSLILSVNATSNILWGTGDNTSDITVIPPSNTVTTYYVDITETGNICSDSVDITVLPQINIQASSIAPSSQNNCTSGTVFGFVSGGAAPYTFNWDTNNATYAITQNIFNLCEDTYCLTVTDDNNCKADTCVNVEFNPCNVNLYSDTILCNGDPSLVQVSVNGQLGPFPLNQQPRYVYSIYSLNPTTLIESNPFGLDTFIFNTSVFAGQYLVVVEDRTWQDSCFSNITISEPDPILIYTTITNTTFSWTNDGSIQIDSITGAIAPLSITWYDSSYTQSYPGTPILFDSLLLDSLYYSYDLDYWGGYSITVTDANGCTDSTTLFVLPDSTVANIDTFYVVQHETCWGDDDGIIHVLMSDSAVPPFDFYWVNIVTNDTLPNGPPNANPWLATHNNLAPGFYSFAALDAFGNPGDFIDVIEILAADSTYVIITPDVESVLLNCSENILLSATAFPLPASAQLIPDTTIMSNSSGNTEFELTFDGTVNGATYTLYDAPQRTYFLECDGELTDTSNPAVNYDAAFMDYPGNPTAQNVIWSWNSFNGGTVPLLNAADYNLNHEYSWAFSANSNGAVQNGLNPNMFDHEFIVSTTIMQGFPNVLTCRVFGVSDTVIYNYSWTSDPPGGPNPPVLSDSDTLLTDSSIIVTTEYTVEITNINGCTNEDVITVQKDLNTLLLDSLAITPVRPCYGDLSGEIHISVVDSSGVQPFTFVLYDIDTNFIQSTSDTFFTGLASGNYIFQVQDTIGCLNPFSSVFIEQPDTIFACGVDLLNDTTFDIFTHTVIANDPLTWIFQMGVLAPNFLYYLEIDSTFGLHSTQQLPTTFNQDAAFDGLTNNAGGSPIVNPTPGPYWTVNGDVLRPDIDIQNSTNNYIYNNPSDVNGLGTQNDYFTGSGNTLNFEFIDGDNDTISNQGGLVFKLHKIACTQIDTAYTCKGEGLGFAYVRPQSVNGNLGGIPYSGTDGILGTSDDYYETAWIKYNPSNGTIIDTIQGGPGFGPSDTIVNLFAGSYRVVVIDSLGCSEFVRYLEVLEPIDTFITILDSSINVLCKYDSTGEIHLSNYGGFDSIAFNGSTIVPIASRTSRYAVLLKDTAVYSNVYNPCGNFPPALPSANYLDTIMSFYGVLDSIIFDNLTAARYRVYVYDSIPDSNYGKHDPFTGELLSIPFNYMQCPNIIDVFISEPCDSLRSFTSVLTNVKCWGDSTAQAAVSAFGGAEPWVYTYQWHNAPFGVNGIGEVGPSANFLWADTTQFPSPLWHTVTVTDPNGCTVEDSVEIKHSNRKIQPFYITTLNGITDTILELKFIEDSVSCFNLCDGMVSLETFGGVLPHTYVFEVNPLDPVLNLPGAADTIDGLCEGGHNIIITDYVGCTDTILYRINEPDELEVVASEDQPIQCFGYNNGTAFALGYGGNNLSNQQSSYTFNWFIDGILYNTIDSLIGVGNDIDNLPPGIHTVQITDYKGCVATDTVEMIEPTQLTVMIIDTSTVYAYCEFTNSAKLCAQAFGGTPGYRYLWNDISSQNNTSFPLFENSQFCAENLQPINTNHPDGDYTVYVRDSRDCPARDSINIDTITNTFNANSIRYTATDVSCFGGFDGSISIDSLVMIDSLVISNGILDTTYYYSVVYSPLSAYNITWIGPGGFSQTGADIGTLFNGVYSVYIEDTMGCQRNKNVTIDEPAKLQYGIYNWTHETCIGDGLDANSSGSCDGQIMVNISGGTGNYYWDRDTLNVWPILPQHQELIINDTLIKDLCNAEWRIFITDDNGCDGVEANGATAIKVINTLVNTSLAVTNIPYGFANVSTEPTTCSNSNDGEAKIPNVPGANPLLNYSWILGTYTLPTSLNTIVDIGSSTSILPVGLHTLVAHYADAASFGVNYEGCDAKKQFVISGPPAIQENSTVTMVNCWGENTGKITLSPSGGAGGYVYAWDTTLSLPSGANTLTVNNLLAGTYTVTITDAAGCEITRAIIVTQPDQLQNDYTIIDVKCNGGNNGVITEGGFGGVAPYNYTVRDANGAIVSVTPLIANNLEAGTYSVEIMDDNTCEVTDFVTVGEPNPLTLSLEPTYNYGVDDAGLNYAISCNGTNTGEVLAVVAGGMAPYKYIWSSGSFTNPAIDLSEGILTLNLEDDNECTITESVTLLEPDAINDKDSISSYGNALNQVSCLGAFDGLISLNPSGGVKFSNGLYSYTWTGPNGFSSTSKDIYDLEIGNYFVDIEDANGCVYKFDYDLIAPLDSFIANVTTLNYAGAAHPPVNVTFIDSTKDISGNSIVVNHYWSWSNDNVMPITEYQQFSYEFTEVGPNEVYVVVENASTGCKDTVNFVVQVQGIDLTTNVFSPNSDGINDEFVFNETGIKVVSVEIYNRWGSLVMNWTGLDRSWDGTGSDGQKLPEAVYFYILSGEGEDGYYYENKGTITLRR